MAGQDALSHDYPHHAGALHDLALRSDYGYISRREFNVETADLVGLTVDEFQTRYWAANVRNESAFAWIRELRQDGALKVGLLSNIGRGWLDDFVPVSERDQLFDMSVLSGEVGMIKPSMEIFELAAHNLGVEPHECIMIDDLLVNIEGAQRTGMQGIVFSTTTGARTELVRILQDQSA